jgi:predicted DCC family thiol-disulfide oxidoreductase YuxK
VNPERTASPAGKSTAAVGVWTPLRTVFGCDLRTLALVRICIGSLIIADLLIRAQTLTAHYTDAGVLPRGAFLALFSSWPTSTHFLAGSFWIQAALFIVAGLVAVALLLGYQARLAAFVSWILLISLDARNPFVSQGGDMLLRVLVLWCVFLPIGARFSVDAALNREGPRSDAHFSMGSMALLLQAASVYFFTALLKSDPVWIPDGTAVYFALNNDSIVTWFGEWLRQSETLMQLLTYFVWILEIATPLLLFSPVFHLQLRLTGLILMLTMHIGFLASMHIALFPFISITSLLAFTPGAVWDSKWIQRRWRAAERTGIKIFYDRDCTFCRKLCLVLRAFLLPSTVPILPAQDDPGIYQRMQTFNSWVVLDHTGAAFVRWAAVALLFRRSIIFAPLGRLFSSTVFSRLGERIYDLVARNRLSLGRVSAVVMPYRTIRQEVGAVGSLAIAILLLSMLAVNVAGVEQFRFTAPAFAREISTTLRFDQKWNMFAPAPSKGTPWFVARGRTVSGEVVDVFLDWTGEPLWNKEDYLAVNNDSYRWRKYLAQIATAERIELRPFYLDYLCRDWDRNHAPDRALEFVELHLVMDWNRINELPRRENHLLWQTDCGADPLAEVFRLRDGAIRTSALSTRE